MMPDPRTLPTIVYNEIAARLEDHARHARGAYSSETERAVRSDTAIFSTWCSNNGHQMLPASPETLVAFIDTMSETRAAATIRRYLSSIAHLHRAASLDTPTSAEIVKLAIKRATKGRSRQHQAAALNRPLIDQIIGDMGDRPIDLRDKALISVAYDTLCRRSVLVAIDVEDITITDDGTGTVLIRRTKTDQAGEGSVRFIAHDTCQHLLAWIETAEIGIGEVFRAVSKGGVINGRLDGSEVSRIYKRHARAAGVDPADISGHSSRVGAAQDLVAADLGVAEVMQAGGWKSPQMVARYTEHLQARRGAMSKLAAKQGRL